MISQQKIKEWVDLYLTHIKEITPEAHVRKEEGYKFKAVDTFQQNFNLDAPDFRAMLDRAIEHTNLVAVTMYLPRRVLLLFAQEYEEDTRRALRALFDESREVIGCINQAEKMFDNILARWNNAKENKMEHTFMGIRFLSLLSAFKYPDKHNAIKPREWKIFCKFIDDDFFIPPHTSSGEQYKKYEECIEALRSYIKNIPQIIDIRDQLTRGLGFRDEELRWTVQDVIYVTARVLAGQKSAEKPQQDAVVVPGTFLGIKAEEAEVIDSSEMEFPLEEYLENFIVQNWKGIDFGEPLELYIDDDGVPAQQYPTDVGIIDLLAKDNAGNFVVIELKKGRSNQQVVGQILTYIGCVKNNWEEKGKKVRGVIVAADGNRALLEAVGVVSNLVSVKYYRVKFNFIDPE